jgi:hypothetical protein
LRFSILYRLEGNFDHALFQLTSANRAFYLAVWENQHLAACPAWG